jgi:hypothetical protein
MHLVINGNYGNEFFIQVFVIYLHLDNFCLLMIDFGYLIAFFLT